MLSGEQADNLLLARGQLARYAKRWQRLPVDCHMWNPLKPMISQQIVHLIYLLTGSYAAKE